MLMIFEAEGFRMVSDQSRALFFPSNPSQAFQHDFISTYSYLNDKGRWLTEKMKNKEQCWFNFETRTLILLLTTGKSGA
jgi:hypothetical protein